MGDPMGPAEAAKVLRNLLDALSRDPLENDPVNVAVQAGIEALEQVQALKQRLADYEHAINWQTSCTSCAKLLDASIADHERAEQAAAQLADFRTAALQFLEVASWLAETTVSWGEYQQLQDRLWTALDQVQAQEADR